MEPQGKKLITIAIHTYQKATELKSLLESEGIEVTLHNVNLEEPVISSGVRVRIHENDLPLALKVIEQNTQLISKTDNVNTNSGDEDSNPNILIPVDFSDYSLLACKIGFDFAAKLNAHITILYSYVSANFAGSLPFNSDKFSSNISIIQDEESIKKISHSKMRLFVRNLNKQIEDGRLPKVSFSEIVTEGVPEESIIEFAKDKQSILVVMGTRGKDKKEADLIGSVTAEVLDSGKFPVFTVPENFSLSNIYDIKKAVFFCNFCQEDLISFDTFVRLFKFHPIDISIIPVDKLPQKMEEQTKALLEYSNNIYPNFSFEIKTFKDGNFSKEFDQYIKDENINLIIIPNKKRNIFARLFNPGIAHKMLFHSDTPLLVVPI